jgi:integrase
MKRASSKQKSIPLSEFVDQYVDLRNRERPINKPLNWKTTQNMSNFVSTLSRFLGRRATLDDLNAETVNNYLSSMLINGKSAWTVKHMRTLACAFWRAAHRLDLLPPCHGVRRVHTSQINVQGYDDRAMTTLVEHAATLRGVLRNGLPKRMWWETLLLVLWETGVRCGDITYIELKHFDPKGWLWIIEHKTGKRGWRYIRPSVCERLKEFIEFDSSRQFIWPGYKPRSLARAFRKLVDATCVGGSLRWIRRGAASEVERQAPGSGWRFLRHSVPTLFDKHYRVEKIVEQQPIAPPEIEPNVFRPIVAKTATAAREGGAA